MSRAKDPHNGKDQLLVERINSGDEKAFEELFFEFYYPLCRFAFKVTRSQDLSRDVVQEVFLKIWRGRDCWQVEHSLRVYLYQAVRNQALNVAEKQNRQQNLSEEFAIEIQSIPRPSNDPDSKRYSPELIRTIWKVVSEMPERRRMVFELHRRHGLSYKEIASVMDISEKTVENHMGYALQHLRDTVDLNKFMP